MIVSRMRSDLLRTMCFIHLSSDIQEEILHGQFKTVKTKILYTKKFWRCLRTRKLLFILFTNLLKPELVKGKKLGSGLVQTPSLKYWSMPHSYFKVAKEHQKKKKFKCGFHLRKLSNSDVWSSLKIHVALDNAVVSDEIGRVKENCYLEFSYNVNWWLSDLKKKQITKPIVNLCQNGSHDTGSDWNPLLLIIPLRLGLSSINPIYISGLKVVPFNASFQVMVSFTFQLELNSRRAFKCLSP